MTVLDGIRRLAGSQTKILHAPGCGILDAELLPVPSSWLRPAEGMKEKAGLKAEYFNGHGELEEPVLTRTDAQIRFNWIYSKPGEGVHADRFSVRWTGKLVPDRDFEGHLGIGGLDSMRLWVDGALFVDTWTAGQSLVIRPFRFRAGVETDIRMEFRNDQRGAKVVFGYREAEPDLEEAVRLAAQADVAIVCVGDSEDTCGENLDRASLDLPGRQGELVRRVHATGTPVVLVLQNGRPISFPRHVGQLPVHYNRKPFGATKYVEMDWNPLYPFGFGLSYTQFAYGDLHLSARTIHPDETVTVTFRVTNTGNRAGEEVPQLYLHDTYSSVIKPYRELAGFTRIHLEPGESGEVQFVVGERALRTLRTDGTWVVEPGAFEVMVGPDSARVWLEGGFTVVKESLPA